MLVKFDVHKINSARYDYEYTDEDFKRIMGNIIADYVDRLCIFHEDMELDITKTIDTDLLMTYCNRKADKEEA